MQPRLIRTVPVDNMMLLLNTKPCYMGNTNYFNKNSQSHIKVKVPHFFTPIVPLPTFVYPIVPLPTSCATPPPPPTFGMILIS